MEFMRGMVMQTIWPLIDQLHILHKHYFGLGHLFYYEPNYGSEIVNPLKCLKTV